MSRRLSLRRLPEPYRHPAGRLCRRLLSIYANTVALVVIGSVARGTWKDDSDLDLIWVHRGRLPREWRAQLDYWCEGPVELVPFNLTQVRRHFRQHSPMAHAIHGGVSLYDAEGLHGRWQQLDLRLPKQEWIEETYDFMSSRFEWGMDSYRRERDFHRCAGHGSEDCSCTVSEILTRATLNLVRLLLTVCGHVPLCKTHTRELYPGVIRGRRLRRAMEITLLAHHQNRDPTLVEATEVVYLGKWTKKRLAESLGVPQACSLR